MSTAVQTHRTPAEPIDILRGLMRTSPFQPATNLWRVVELDAVRRHGMPEGLGLDLGCGDGKLTVILENMLPDAGTRRWVGVDIDPAETALARATGFYERVHTASGDAVAEPDASFDFVFSNSVLEHVGPIEAVLADAARVLKPGGRFLATVPGPDFHACLAGGGADREAYFREIDTRCAHLRYWTPGEWTQALDRVGLDLVLAKPYLSVEQVQRWESLSNWTGGLAYKVFGRKQRPIEIQRRFAMRREDPGLAGHMGSALTALLAAGCPITGESREGPSGCILVEAVKR